eukprot:sb/3478970/
MLSGIRAWSIARPFKYKLHSGTGHTLTLSGLCWLFGVVWIAVKHILGCRWGLQIFFTYTMPACADPSSPLAKKIIAFPFDFLPVFCGALFTSISNG